MVAPFHEDLIVFLSSFSGKRGIRPPPYYTQDSRQERRNPWFISDPSKADTQGRNDPEKNKKVAGNAEQQSMNK